MIKKHAITFEEDFFYIYTYIPIFFSYLKLFIYCVFSKYFLNKHKKATFTFTYIYNKKLIALFSLALFLYCFILYVKVIKITAQKI